MVVVNGWLHDLVLNHVLLRLGWLGLRRRRLHDLRVGVRVRVGVGLRLRCVLLVGVVLELLELSMGELGVGGMCLVMGVGLMAGVLDLVFGEESFPFLALSRESVLVLVLQYTVGLYLRISIRTREVKEGGGRKYNRRIPLFLRLKAFATTHQPIEQTRRASNPYA